MKAQDNVFATLADGTTPFIYETENLAQFKNYEFNRDLDYNHIKVLSKKIRDFTLCPLLVKIESDGLYIIDGQHRLEVAKARKGKLYYRIVEMDSLDIAELQIKKNWTILNWVKYWTYQRNPYYEVLLQMYETYNISILTIASLLVNIYNIDNRIFGIGKGGGQSSNTINIVKGIFKFSEDNEYNARKILKQLNDFPKDLRTKTNFIKAFLIIKDAHLSKFSEYDHLLMKKRLTQYPEKFIKQVSTLEYVRMLETTMNIGLSDNNKLRFF